ncbi:hypothetical protein EBE87_25920 [Pseudoroseomonas wenyumeiae]|uniref:Uncharacterized protein n=1 Tax=Teichococcus wenyumeiae TaxID=2478470 RepID=A0A3A9JI17_9PROT|nr:hypothetical protein [Pseudoroseomonas wenyumeiae]RKK03316.1 hypothetical protein D6Z83_15260 [Pseudoroseomonas wenyumeiae]RMI15416.1 hypothetical protein EBE87_25920 [Pseudoroseomonas wenyumeiae]
MSRAPYIEDPNDLLTLSAALRYLLDRDWFTTFPHYLARYGTAFDVDEDFRPTPRSWVLSHLGEVAVWEPKQRGKGFKVVAYMPVEIADSSPVLGEC